MIFGTLPSDKARKTIFIFLGQSQSRHGRKSWIGQSVLCYVQR